MRLLPVVILTCLAVSVCSCYAAHSDSPSQRIDGEQPGTAGKQDVRVHFKLPKWFNFAQFKEQFGKVYGSLLEEMVRQKIFLGRAFQAFISIIKYRHFQETYYLSVNPDSDQTPAERERLRISADTLRESLDLLPDQHRPPLPERMKSDDLLNNEEGKLIVPVAEMSDIEQGLMNIEQHKDEPGYKELADELSRLKQKNSRRKRDVNERLSVSAENLFDRPLHPGKLSPELERKIMTHPTSNNPNYEQPELSSSASNSNSESCNKKQTLSPGFMNFIMNASGANFVKSLIEDHQSKERLKKWHAKKKNLRDEVKVDLRDKNCLFQPRKQIGCGSCYAFTAVAYYEYLYCKQTGNLVPFSEQYIVDCGHLSELNGCAGGRLSRTIVFVEKYGLELRHNYPYRAVQDTCPYVEQPDISPDPNKMGYIRVKGNKGFGLLSLLYFEEHLELGKPIMFALNLSPDFHYYGGGVHDSYLCDKSDSHAMLIIGYGVEDGINYYLLRNSYSVFWGEQGYYKISKESLYYCRSNDFGLVSLVDFKSDDAKNRNTEREASVIGERYLDYMRKSTQGKR